MAKFSDTSLQQYLDSGEHVLWNGRPRQGFAFQRLDLLLIPFSLLWSGFMFFGAYSFLMSVVADDFPYAPSLFDLVWILFSAIGIYLVVGRFLFDRYYRSGLLYAITDQRVLIRGKTPWKSMTSYDLSTLSGLKLVEHSNGRGTIQIDQSSRSGFGSGNGLEVWHPCFGRSGQLWQVEQPREVMRILRESVKLA
ncbi:MAG: hypothetical protein AAFV45_15120 [Pseudomonadota bacterium]